MMLRLPAMMALAFSVSGCATGDDPVLYTGSIKPVAPTLIADVAPDYAAAYLPQVAGRMEAVRQSSKPDHIFQTILYPNSGYRDGENALTVSIAPRSSSSSYFTAPSERQIVSEMRSVLPGVAMRIATTPGANLHGPFGYAISAGSDSGACIYAWQTASDIGGTGQTGFRRFTSTHYAAKIRLRYCHPTMTEASLVSLMAGLRIREVSESTMEMLRFSEGTGIASRPTFAAEQPAPAKVTASNRPAPARQKPETSASADPAVPVRNAPRVLKPGELAGYAAAQVKSPVVAPVETPTAAVRVPLPAAVNR